MKLLYLITFLVLLIIGIGAYDSQRQVLITYPDDTTSSSLAEAKIRIEAAGGEILHEFEYIKGFVVKATTNALEAFKIATSEFGPQPTVEDNGPVEILG
ncbi:hypothetical protein MMC29_008296 [Sticta canariensis]|nr:hypothetical protein [Sticta canariensis]